MKIHHLGIACISIENTMKYLENIFPKMTFKEILYDPIQEAKLTISNKSNGMRFELIQGEKIEKFVSKNIPFYHICFEVIDIEKKINFFEEEGGIIISAPAPAVLFNGRKVSFIYTEIGIVELLEAEN